MKRAPSQLLTAGLLVGLSGLLHAAPGAPGADAMKTIVAQPFVGEWKGWGRYSEPAPVGHSAAPLKEQFTVVPTPAGQVRSFSGKVTGPGSMQGALVGVVSMVDVWWLNRSCYEWAPVQPDGTFRVESQRYPTAVKAVFVLAPGHPYSFLRYNFKAEESGRDITLRAQPGKLVRFSVEVPGQPSVPWFHLEPFEAYRSVDDRGEALTKRQYGRFSAERNDIVLCLPAEGPIALYIRAEGGAQHYAIIDTAEADHFRFQLLPEARLKGRVLRGKEPVANVDVILSNDLVPLSVTNTRTDGAGNFERGGLAPGRWDVNINGRFFGARFAAGQTLETTYTFAPLPANVNTREIPATSYFLVAKELTWDQVAEFARAATAPLEQALAGSGMEAAGPVEFHYQGMTGGGNKPFTLQIAIPVKAAKPYTGQYEVKAKPAVQVASKMYAGGLSGMKAAWTGFAREVQTSGYTTTGESRELFNTSAAPDPGGESTELQLVLNK